MENGQPPIKSADYERIFRIVHSVSESVGNTIGRSCLFYNVVGAAILEAHYNVRAVPIVGSAFFLLHQSTSTVLSFSHFSAEGIYSSSEAFHCWVQANGYAIDFSAPVYGESLTAAGSSLRIERRMFRKAMNRMATSHDSLAREGDFHLSPNPELTLEILRRASAKPATNDLAHVCMSWYRKPPRGIQSQFKMVNDLGEVTSISLTDLRVSGAW